MKKIVWTVYNQHCFVMNTSGKALSGIGEKISSLKAVHEDVKKLLVKLKAAVVQLDEVIKTLNTVAVSTVQKDVCLVMNADYVGIRFICRGWEKCGTAAQKKAGTTILSSMDTAKSVFTGAYYLQIGAVKPQIVKMKKHASCFATLGLTDVFNHLSEYSKKYSTDYSATVQEFVEGSSDVTYQQAKDAVILLFQKIKAKVDGYQVEDERADSEEDFVIAANLAWSEAAKSQAAAKAARDKAKAEKKKLEEEAKKAEEEAKKAAEEAKSASK